MALMVADRCHTWALSRTPWCRKIPVSASSPVMPLPLDIDDSDLDPNMEESPIKHNGIAEVSFCSLLFEIDR